MTLWIALSCTPVSSSDPPVAGEEDSSVSSGGVLDTDTGPPLDSGCADRDPDGTVRSVRVRTVQSPSWVAWAEVELHGLEGGERVSLTPRASLRGSHAQGLERVRDGDSDTAWNAGDFAPQWLQLDFDEPVVPSTLRLTVAQSPAGETVHVLETAGPCGDFQQQHRWSAHTSEGQVLTWEAQPFDGDCGPLDLNLVLKKDTQPCWDCEFWFYTGGVAQRRPRLEVRWRDGDAVQTSVFQDGPLGTSGPLHSAFIMGADALLGPGSCPDDDDACRENFLHQVRAHRWDGVNYYNGLVTAELSSIPCEATIEDARLWLWIHEQRGLAGADHTSTATWYRGVRPVDIQKVHGLRYAVAADGSDLLWSTPGGDVGEPVQTLEAQRDLWDRGFHKGSPDAWFDFTDHLVDLQHER